VPGTSPIWAASGGIPKQPLKTKAEAIDLVVPLASEFVSLVQYKFTVLAWVLIEGLRAEERQLWLIRALRARQTSSIDVRRGARLVLRAFLSPSATLRGMHERAVVQGERGTDLPVKYEVFKKSAPEDDHR